MNPRFSHDCVQPAGRFGCKGPPLLGCVALLEESHHPAQLHPTTRACTLTRGGSRMPALSGPRTANSLKKRDVAALVAHHRGISCPPLPPLFASFFSLCVAICTFCIQPAVHSSIHPSIHPFKHSLTRHTQQTHIHTLPSCSPPTDYFSRYYSP